MSNGDDFVYPFKDGDSLNAGITLKQYFAGLALQGICASREYVEMTYPGAADMAVKQAAALIAALNESEAAPAIATFPTDALVGIELGRKLGYIIGDDWTEWKQFMAILFKGKTELSDLTEAEHSQWLSTLRAMERACEVAKRKEGVTA